MNKYIVEFCGTLFLSFVAFATGNYLAIGLALAIAILLGGTVSDAALFNPAITIAMFYADKLPHSDLIPYLMAQIAGALAGMKMVKQFIK
jgi:aquaporin Z